MTHDDDKWIPPSSTEEIIKNFLIPPQYYMRHLVRKNLRKGEPELHLLPFLVNRNKQAIDIGANKGVYTHLLARLVPFVHAFEPNPKMFNVLTRGLPENARSYEIALSDQSGSGELLVPKLQEPTSWQKRAYANLGASLSRQKVQGEHGVVQI
ncbi:MAG: FkbM family methyltransferase, partial [Gammaproteobacteria bacterium]